MCSPSRTGRCSEREELGCPVWAEWRFETGQISHLGRTDLVLTQCSMFVVPPFVGRSEGTTTFTAANGDALVLAHEWEFEIVFNDIPAPDGFFGHGTWTVVEGTGRFSNATGSGSMTTLGDVPTDDTPLYDLPAGATLWTFTGTIASSASDRSNT